MSIRALSVDRKVKVKGVTNMIAYTNRGRLAVEVGGKWRLYTNTIPEGAEAIGVVSRDELGGIGALVKLSSGNYVQINAGVLRNLDGREVAAALGTAGRPSEMSDGKAVCRLSP